MTEFKMVHKPHKMVEWLEGECTEWADGIIKEHFQVEDTDTLSKEQIEEVIAEWELLTDSPSYDFLGLGFRNIISSWENENDEYLI